MFPILDSPETTADSSRNSRSAAVPSHQNKMAANDKPVTGDRVRSSPDRPERISDYDLDNNKGQEAAIVTERPEAVGLVRNRKEKPTLNFRFTHSFSQNTVCMLLNYAVKSEEKIPVHLCF